MKESDSLSDKVVAAADIVAIISEYINLEKKGSDYKGLCPFHNDSRPSLSVSPSKRLYKCFSCNAAGNVINFVQRFENISFMDALKKVALKSGVTLDIKENPLTQKYTKYYKILQDVSSSYEFFLKNTIEGQKALEYLYKRNIDDEIIKRFHIGLSSHSDNIICKIFIDEKHILPLDLKVLGLVTIDNDNIFDTFRGRIMFPITDLKGNIVGFSGRVYDKSSNSKYVNTHENEIFKKNQILFNYFEALNEIKLQNKVFIFEGFMDVIAAFKAGVSNSIATMGTALTENQIKIIGKTTNNIVLLYDGDEAGIAATKRAIKLFHNNGINPSVVMLPEGLDPDDYLNQYGKEAFKDLLDNKQISAIDYLYNIEARRLNINDPNSILEFQKKVYDIISLINNKTVEVYLLRKLSTDLSLNLDEVSKSYNNIRNTISKTEVSNNAFPYEDLNKNNNNNYIDYNNVPEIPEDYYNSNLVPPDIFESDVKEKKRRIKYKKEKYDSAEQGLIYLSFYNRNDCVSIRQKLAIDDFVDRVNRNILFELYAYYELADEMNKDEFIKKLDSLELERLNSIINSCNFYSVKSIDEFIDLVKSSKYEKSKEDICNELENKKKEISPEMLEQLTKVKKKTIKIKKNNKE